MSKDLPKGRAVCWTNSEPEDNLSCLHQTSSSKSTTEKQSTHDWRTAAYTAAATATLATAATSSAEILNSGLQNIVIGQGSGVFIDLDFDSSITGYEYGLGDIFVKNYIFGGGNYLSLSKATGDTGTWVGYNDGRGFGYASALSAGDEISSSTVGTSAFANLGYQATGAGQFNDYPATEKYVGLAFTSDALGGTTHYGWIKLLASVPGGQFTLVDWAFESEADTAIAAGDTGNGTLITEAIPEPSTLGLLAAGAIGLASFRNRKQSA